MEAQVPAVVAPLNAEREEYWRHVDDSVNAVSFGFVATAILISMFLLMAIFEKFLRSRSQQHPSPSRTSLDLEQQRVYGAKFDYPSPKVTSFFLSLSLSFFSYLPFISSFFFSSALTGDYVKNIVE